MTSKSTHRGHCQLCGHFQKLPGGRLAQHGYTVEWGFFEGVCPGTGGLPYEVSTDLIEASIANAEQAALHADTAAATLLADAAPTHVWEYQHIPATWTNRKASARWNRHAIADLDVRRDERTGGVSLYTVEDKPRGFYTIQHGYAYSIDNNDVHAVARHLNAKRAAAYIKHADQLRRYADWQRARIADWKPADLTPIA